MRRTLSVEEHIFLVALLLAGLESDSIFGSRGSSCGVARQVIPQPARHGLHRYLLKLPAVRFVASPRSTALGSRIISGWTEIGNAK